MVSMHWILAKVLIFGVMFLMFLGVNFWRKILKCLRLHWLALDAEIIPWGNNRKFCHIEHETEVVHKHYVQGNL